MKTIKEVILEVANSRGIPMCANGTTVEFLEECLSRIDAEQSADMPTVPQGAYDHYCAMLAAAQGERNAD